MSVDQSKPAPEFSRPPSSAPTGPGYFHIYKKGQGYWTRMGTVFAAALIAALTANFIWSERELLPIASERQDRIAFVVIAAFLAGFAALTFHLMNKPTNAEFLIATDSEMKRVNWTSRKDLIDSTKIVILFMAFIAAVLFVYDLFFHTLFWLIGVLKTPPPFIKP